MNSAWNQQVRSDCEELLARFQQTDSVRFEIFCKTWREMKFGHIFFGTAGREKRAFSRLALDAAAIYFLPPFSFQIRTGGLYLLYSLYQCQRTSPPIRIRLALKDWEDVVTFQKEALGAQHLDAVFVLHQLLFHKAFHLTAMPTLLTFKGSKETTGPQQPRNFVAGACGPQELIDRDALEELSDVHRVYGELKLSVYSQAQLESLGVDLHRKNLPALVRGYVVAFHSWQQKMRQEESAEDRGAGGSSETTSSQAESSRRAQLLSSIKSKAYGQATEVCKSRRHRRVDLDTGEHSGPASPKVPRRRGKISLRARTKKNVCIVGRMSKEAATSTRIQRLTTLDAGPRAKREESAGQWT
ncbi:snRNA-activating protein complex subunit 1b isoform X2 [Syngnathus typhle]|uniref:snRNA-activating protein complex subunit 1b isoform X2 n=1 Tax=Syngnathus typhle TaxID=161592 RepID=UPI002A69B21A|nr:snRNA-activating protein complex subunit 1b isoform X2 [Syngnathus typhle]